MAERFHRSRDGARFIECSVYVLRLLAEQEAFSKISKVEARILKFFDGPDRVDISPKILSRMHYVLGICLVYQDGKHEEAMDSFRESIQLAIECGDRSALAWPLYGAATVLYARRRYDDALRELDKLTTLLSCKNIPELSTSALLLNALILRNQKRLDDSLQSAWAAFDSLKQQPHLGLYMHTLATLGTIFREKGEPAAARIYLDLAKRSLKRSEFPRIARIVDEAIEMLGDETVAYDLALNLKTGSLYESRKGEIRFDGQFLLRDLLTVFLRSALKGPSIVLKKEDLVREVWGESYQPQRHDNKIYVNIKRLRRLIEGDDGSTEYILRGKQGYYLNPKARIFLVEADSSEVDRTTKRTSPTHEAQPEQRSEV